MKRLLAFIKEEEGVTAIEYGLIAAGIGIFIVTGIALVGGGLNTLFGTVATELN